MSVGDQKSTASRLLMCVFVDHFLCDLWLHSDELQIGCYGVVSARRVLACGIVRTLLLLRLLLLLFHPCPGGKTSFRCATGLQFGAAVSRDKAQLPEDFADAIFCDDWSYRLEAATRTWQRPHAQDNLM